MRIITLPTTARLAPYVRGFTVVETDLEASRTLIPESGVVMGLRYRGAARQTEDDRTTLLPDGVLTGIRTTARLMRTAAGGGIVLTNFTELGASAFFPQPMHELAFATLGLDALVRHSELDRVSAQVMAAHHTAERIASIEAFLLSRISEAPPDPLISAAVRAIRNATATVRIGELANRFGLSRDRFEKRFRRAVGLSPKQLASSLRLQRAIALHRAGISLSRVALDAGYFDQSHFIREFRACTGVAPRQFFQAVDHC